MSPAAFEFAPASSAPCDPSDLYVESRRGVGEGLELAVEIAEAVLQRHRCRPARGGSWGAPGIARRRGREMALGRAQATAADLDRPGPEPGDHRTRPGRPPGRGRVHRARPDPVPSPRRPRRGPCDPVGVGGPGRAGRSKGRLGPRVPAPHGSRTGPVRGKSAIGSEPRPGPPAEGAPPRSAGAGRGSPIPDVPARGDRSSDPSEPRRPPTVPPGQYQCVRLRDLDMFAFRWRRSLSAARRSAACRSAGADETSSRRRHSRRAVKDQLVDRVEAEETHARCSLPGWQSPTRSWIREAPIGRTPPGLSKVAVVGRHAGASMRSGALRDRALQEATSSRPIRRRRN